MGYMIKTVLLAYAQIFFSTRLFVGFLFLLATFVVPEQGAAGLAAVILSNLWARFLGFSEEDIKAGYFGYNGLLTGLALGLTYELNPPFFIMLLIAALLGVLIAASLQSLFRRYLFIPVLSIPFVVTTWLMLAGGRQFHGLVYTLKPFEVTMLAGKLPQIADFFVLSLGTTFFQFSTLAGILIAAGLLIFSRYAFILAIAGLFSGSVVYTLLKGDPSDLYVGYVGFNFILTAIAVGGVWAVPGIGSLILAAMGSAVCAIIAAASSYFLNPSGLPPLAFPFVVTTCFILFALQQRGQVFRFRTLTSPKKTPEENLKHYRNATIRFLDSEIPAFTLPVFGEWTITQGVGGRHTHKDLWLHAWDLELTDDKGKAFREDGAAPEDFYAFDMPVYAPGDGKVVTVVTHLEDNPAGQVNIDHNWGNLVIIWHYGSVYSALCHLKQESATVTEGEFVRYGQIVGRVGNSGRSAVPHLHFQIQATPYIGAPTLPSSLLHYIAVQKNGDFYHTHGTPEEGDRIRPLSHEENAFDAACLPLGSVWKYDVRFHGQRWRETWETEMDFSGNFFIVCKENKSRIRYLVNRYVLMFLDYEGPRNTGLYWFFMGLPRLPLTAEKVVWKDELPGELVLSPLHRLIFSLAEPFYPLARLCTTSQFLKTGKQFAVETLSDHQGILGQRKFKGVRTVSLFERYRGLVSLKVSVKGEEFLTLQQVGDTKAEDSSVPIA
jgi:urea transporter/murein DD-endopeptidase MepM/ murein hydrolase activator NlpD